MSKEYRRRISSNKISGLVNNRCGSNKQKMVRTYQPTYQLHSRKRFNIEDVEKTLQRIVTSELEEVEYSDKTAADLCLSLTENIRTAIKEENYDRYRIIVVVSIGQRRQQSVHVFHSFLWDHERDGYVSYNFENCHMFANVVVYGIYFD
ncbi:dynein light chain Tctex-type 5-A-like isoform X2 [Maniola jurtina]|uniref:dynein light chain Tctex-type 5-A-like isoform X2 n=1 Tax=Maniola jurtina TaxID=191418 RepID=UPI001E68B07A|nr:dynein light chain Tctex-type 5-A-like isoform X2 [Maniola jurtina]